MSGIRRAVFEVGEDEALALLDGSGGDQRTSGSDAETSRRGVSGGCQGEREKGVSLKRKPQPIEGGSRKVKPLSSPLPGPAGGATRLKSVATEVGVKEICQ